jgi:hypothetical protein
MAPPSHLLEPPVNPGRFKYEGDDRSLCCAAARLLGIDERSGFAAVHHPYGYVSHEPLNQVDPSGQIGKGLWKGVHAILTAKVTAQGAALGVCVLTFFMELSKILLEDPDYAIKPSNILNWGVIYITCRVGIFGL